MLISNPVGVGIAPRPPLEEMKRTAVFLYAQESNRACFKSEAAQSCKTPHDSAKPREPLQNYAGYCKKCCGKVCAGLRNPWGPRARVRGAISGPELGWVVPNRVLEVQNAKTHTMDGPREDSMDSHEAQGGLKCENTHHGRTP